MAAKTSDIALFKSRSLVGRLSASFKFLNENLTVFLKLGTYVLLPMAVVLALYNAFFGIILRTESGVGPLGVSVVVGIIAVAGSCCFSSLVYTLLKKQAELGVLPTYKLKDLKVPLLANAKKVFFSGLVLFVIGLLLGGLMLGLAMLTPFTLILTVPLLLFVMIPLCYTTYIYIFEDVSLIAALTKSYKLGIPTWGSVFAVVLISSLLALIVQVVACLPWYTAMMVENFAYLAQLRGEAGTLPGFFPYMLFFLAFVGILLSYLANIIVMSAMAFQYGSAETKRKEQLMEENQLL